MYGLGLKLEKRNFTDLVRKPRAVLAGLFCQLLLLPTLAFAIAYATDLPPVFAVGLVLIACCPGGSSSNVLTMLVGGNVALSITLTTLSSFVSVLSVPLVLLLAMQIFFINEKEVALSFLRTTLHNGLVIILPVVLGMLTRFAIPNLATVLYSIIRKTSLPLLLLVILLFTYRQWGVLRASIGDLFGNITLLIGGSTLLGLTTAKVLRLDIPTQRTLVVEIAIQNAALAITIAASPFLLGNETMAVPAIIYAVLMNVFVFSYLGFLWVVRKPWSLLFDQSSRKQTSRQFPDGSSKKTA